MIRLSIATCCPDCGRDNLVKNGTDYKGAQKFRCNECGADGTLDATSQYTPERKAQILRAYQERSRVVVKW